MRKKILMMMDSGRKVMKRMTGLLDTGSLKCFVFVNMWQFLLCIKWWLIIFHSRQYFGPVCHTDGKEIFVSVIILYVGSDTLMWFENA